MEKETGDDETGMNCMEENELGGGLSSSQAEFFIRYGYFLVPQIITEDQCSIILERIERNRSIEKRKEKEAKRQRRGHTEKPLRLPSYLKPPRKELKESRDGHCAQLAKDLSRFLRRRGLKRRDKEEDPVAAATTTKQKQ